MPVILLGLGGLFVFVAVSLFLAVTWEVLPLAVKAALMLGFTAAVGGIAAHLSRKGLRGSAEALWALVAALLMLDLRAGYASGLFGLDQLSTRSVLTLAGGLLVVARRRRRPLGPEDPDRTLRGGGVHDGRRSPPGDRGAGLEHDRGRTGSARRSPSRCWSASAWCCATGSATRRTPSPASACSPGCCSPRTA